MATTLPYHGPTPVTVTDVAMAKKHLKQTKTLNNQKIAEHQVAKVQAQKAGNQKSASYNDSHLKSHKADNAKIQTSMNTVNNLKPIYNKVATMTPVSKTPSVSKGFAGFLAKKKIGAKPVTKVATKSY